MNFPKLYHTCKISSSNVSRYWMVVSLEMWLSNFKNVFANCSGFSLTMASLVLASWVSNLEMKLKSSCAMTCDLIWIYWIKTTAMSCNCCNIVMLTMLKRLLTANILASLVFLDFESLEPVVVRLKLLQKHLMLVFHQGQAHTRPSINIFFVENLGFWQR